MFLKGKNIFRVYDKVMELEHERKIEQLDKMGNLK